MTAIRSRDRPLLLSLSVHPPSDRIIRKGEKQMKKRAFHKSLGSKMLAMLLIIMTLASTFAVSASAATSWPSVSTSSYCEFTASKTIYVWRNNSCTTRGTESPAKSYNAYIESGDVCRIIKFDSSYIKLQYPTSSGYKTGYIKRSDLLGVSAPTNSVTSQGKADTYIKAGGSYYGYVAKGDKVYACGTSGNYTAVIYQAKSGSRAYKLGYVTTANYNTVIAPSGSPVISAKKTISNGTYCISSALNNNMKLDCSGASTDNGANVLIWSGHGGDNQKVKVTYLDNGYYKLEFVHSGKCLDVAEVSYNSGANVHQWAYGGGTNQQWIIADAGNGYYYIVARHSGKFLDIAGGVSADGTNVQVYNGNGTNAQKFKFTKVNSNNATVKLNVPSYKQNDSRWKNVYIGNKTIGAIGCTTTCISMVYSYHTGCTVYPDAMKNKLSYSNNDLIWGSLSKVGLTSITYNRGVSNDMLATIYAKLKEGRPVIIGATTSSGGSQHWVVITGYTGTSTTSFSTSDFIVNDPGSQNSTTLAAFLANGSKTDRTYIKRIIF